MLDGTVIKAAVAALTLLAASAAALLPSSAQTRATALQIIAFGDSLTAGYGLSPGEAFPARLEAALRAKGYDASVVNAGTSGDTSSSALARVDRAVPRGANLVIVELGANDILRGVSPRVTERNLDAIRTRLRARGSEVVLAGMIAPPEFGNAFSRSFNPIYERLAERHSATLYPFFLRGVAGRRNLNLRDGIHPNAMGVQRIVDGILPTVTRKLNAMAG